MTQYRALFLIAAVLIAGCSGRIASPEAQQCTEELTLAESELDRAKADGFGEAMSMTKAAGLITAAQVQKQFEKYAGCTDKAQRARSFITDARHTKPVPLESTREKEKAVGN